MTAGLRRARLRIEGMHCAGCVAHVEKALRNIEGVVDVSVNLVTQSAVVELEASGPSARTLQRAVQLAGYDAVVESESRPSMRRDSGTGLPRGPGADPVLMQAEFLRRQRQALILAVGLSLPILALDAIGHRLAGTQPGGHVGWRVIQAILSAMLVLSPAAGPMIVGGLRALWRGAATMDSLITAGVLASVGAGIASVFVADLNAFHFHAAAMILIFINVGRYLEAKARHQTTDALMAMTRRLPREAMLMTPTGLVRVAADAVNIGDRVQVAASMIIPVDGEVERGQGAVDESSITGESVPVAAGPGSTVRAGAIVVEGDIVVRATRVGADATTGRILRAMEQAQSGTTRLQRIADRVAAVFTPGVFFLSVVTFMVWLLAPEWMGTAARHAGGGQGRIGGVADALRAAVAVLVVACPCALGLATPTAIVVASGRAALRGVLLKDAAVLEQAARTTHLCLDKTGTLTRGRPRVRRILTTTSDAAATEILRLAASVEQLSQHPFAAALVRHAESMGLVLSAPGEFVSVPGRGVQGRIGDQSILVGSLSWLIQRGVVCEASGADERTDADVRDDGASVVWVAADGRILGGIELEDEIREEAADAVAALRQLGLELLLVTGDNEPPARRVAQVAGIREVHAALSPEDKLELVRRLRSSGAVVGFVGDGINDGPALTAADVGMTLRTGTDVAVGAAGVTLLSTDLRRLPELIRLARKTARVIRQNLFWAVIYNVVTLPLAAAGHIPPAVAAATMMLSSLSVVGNSLRLKRTGIGSS